MTVVVSSALGVAASPLPLLAVLLLLTTDDARTSLAGFTAGWTLSVGAVVAGAALLGSAASADGDAGPSTTAAVAQVVAGALLLVIAAASARSARRGDDPPAWLVSIRTVGPARAAVLAALLAGVRPKNLALSVVAAAAILDLPGGTVERTSAFALYVVVASAPVLVPLLAHVVLGVRSQATLTRLSGWMVARAHVLAAVVLGFVGLNLLATSVPTLVA